MVKFLDTRLGGYIRKWKYGRIFNSLTSHDIAIDCGANVGKITQKMADSGAVVYAFEPDPNAFKELAKNLANTPNVILINKAVSDHSGQAKIYFNDRYNENPAKWSVASTLIAEKPHVNLNNFFECEVVDLSEFIENLNKPVSLLKIDIEGEEVKVLNKLIDTGVINSVKKVIAETHERFPTIKEPTEMLKKKIKKLGIRNIDLDWA